MVATSLLLALVTSSAFAQDGADEPESFEANGPDAPPLSGPGVLLWSPAGMVRGEARFGALGEVATGLLSRQVGQDVTTEFPVAAGVNLSAGYAPTDRIGFGVSASVWPAAQGGAGLGKVRVDAPIRLVDSSVSVAAHPWVALPTGTPRRGVASPGLSAGGMLALGTTDGPVRVAGNLGASWRPTASLPAQTIGGPSVDFGASVMGVSGSTHLGVEARGAVSLGTGAVVGSPAPDGNLFAEALGVAGGPLGGGFGWRVGGGTGLTEGIGSPVFRAFLGLSWRQAPEVTIEIAQTTVTDPPDPTASPDASSIPVPMLVQDERGTSLTQARVVATGPTEPVEARVGELSLPPGVWTLVFTAEGRGEQVREIEIREGEVPERVEVVLLPTSGDVTLVHTVLDATGEPVVGATVLVDGQVVGTTDSRGQVRISGLADGDHQLSIEHEGFTAAEQSVRFEGNEALVETALARVPGTVRLSVVNALGDPVPDAVARFMGPRRLAPMPLGDTGTRTEVLGPGQWSVMVSSAQYGIQQREIEVPADSVQRIDVDMVLQSAENGTATLAIRVIDPDGVPLDGVAVSVDGRDFGSTSTGGTLELDGLSGGQRVLEVSSPRHQQVDGIPLILLDGRLEEVVTLRWRPGAVQLTARTPTAPIPDADGRFLGPSRDKSTPLGPLGTAYFELKPGSWTAMVTSPTFGLAERGFEMVEDTGRLLSLDVVMTEPEGGLAALQLEVVDPDGNPVDGAAVFLDGIPFGSAPDGALMLTQLGTGRRALEVTAPLFRAHTSEIQLFEGERSEEVVLDWAAETVRARVVDEQGAPVPDAMLRVLGAETVPPVPVDSAGERFVPLSPGPWQAVAISPTLGLAESSVLVTDSGEGLQTVELVMESVASGRAELLVRVDGVGGSGVAGAEVLAGGDSVGTTSAAGVLTLHELLPGPVTLEVRAEGYTTASSEIVVPEGASVRTIALEGVPGLITVRASDTSGNPVDATVSLLGPNDWLPTPLGSDGEEVFLVDPGTWEVVLTADGFGAGRSEVELAPDGRAEVALVLGQSQVQIAGDSVRLDDVLFAVDSATLESGSKSLLDEVAAILRSNPQLVSIEVQGHTDSTGDLARNQALSTARAQSVRRALVSRGVPPESLTARGYGPRRPVSDNDTEAGRAKNRRVQFELTER